MSLVVLRLSVCTTSYFHLGQQLSSLPTHKVRKYDFELDSEQFWTLKTELLNCFNQILSFKLLEYKRRNLLENPNSNNLLNL